MKIAKPQGEVLEHDGGGNLKEALLAIDKSLLKDYIGARLDGERIDLHTALPPDAEVELIANDTIGANVTESTNVYFRKPNIYAGLKVNF